MLRAAAIGILLLALACGGWYWYSSGGTTHNGTAAQEPYAAPELAKSYRSDAYGFLLRMPEDFSAQEMPHTDDGGSTIVLQNEKGEGVQILISPFDEDEGSFTLNEERIRADIPDMAITDAQPVEVGPQYTGLAFRSDNEAFSGASREVWFVFKGNLYQISTYERLDPLLRAIFSTWHFD